MDKTQKALVVALAIFMVGVVIGAVAVGLIWAIST